jgi:hypothetical protein
MNLELKLKSRRYPLLRRSKMAIFNDGRVFTVKIIYKFDKKRLAKY